MQDDILDNLKPKHEELDPVLRKKLLKKPLLFILLISSIILLSATFLLLATISGTHIDNLAIVFGLPVGWGLIYLILFLHAVYSINYYIAVNQFINYLKDDFHWIKDFRRDRSLYALMLVLQVLILFLYYLAMTFGLIRQISIHLYSNDAFWHICAALVIAVGFFVQFWLVFSFLRKLQKKLS